MRILLTGAAGQLGISLQQTLSPHTVVALSHAALSIEDTATLKSVLRDHSIEWIINCAAFTDVKKAEQNPAQAYMINKVALAALARCAQQSHLKVIHLSTNYVFKSRPDYFYKEYDFPQPQNLYGASKLSGENALLAHCPGTTVIRTSSIYSVAGHRFIHKIIAQVLKGEPFPVLANVYTQPTAAEALAHFIAFLVDHPQSGLFHFTGKEVISYYDYATLIYKTLATLLPNRLLGAPFAQEGSDPIRPASALLSNEKRQAFYPDSGEDLKIQIKKVINQIILNQIKALG